MDIGTWWGASNSTRSRRATPEQSRGPWNRSAGKRQPRAPPDDDGRAGRTMRRTDAGRSMRECGPVRRPPACLHEAMKPPAALQAPIDDGVLDAVLRPLKIGREAGVYVVRGGGAGR